MKKIIIGNMKMNTKPSEFKLYAMALATKTKGAKNTVVICPPFTHLSMAREFLGGSKVAYGAQNISEEENGSLTGEVSAAMVKDLGAEYVILGHSDRRGKFKETDKLTNKKLKMALANGLKVILCVGESAQTRAAKGGASAFVRKQLDDSLKGLYENELESVIIAYEPIWAIGTGKTATKVDINRMVEVIRKEISLQFSEKAGKNIKVLYGGSINAANHTKIISNPCLDGVLIGGTCLDVDAFSMIAKENY